MLRHELSSPPARLLLSGLVLKDGGRNHYAFPGVDHVVSHESRHFADDGQEVLLDLPRHLARVGHTLVPPYRSVHSFCTTSLFYAPPVVLKRLLQLVVKLVQQFPQLGVSRQTAKKSLLYLNERSKQIGYLLLFCSPFVQGVLLGHSPLYTLLFDCDRYREVCI